VKNQNRIVRAPQVDERAGMPYFGIREVVAVPMGQTVPRLFKELSAWTKKAGVTPAGPRFLRFHVIDMARQYDLEVGIPVAPDSTGLVLGDGSRVHAGQIPAGHYASLVYSGGGYAGNKALIEWAQAQGLAWERWDDPNGDAFRCRYESYLTDRAVEPRKTLWEIEVAIKLEDGG
jgi:effector-binding domain-containing protein